MRAYQIYVTPQAWAEMKDLPGNMKQRVKRAVEELTKQPKPGHSKN
jgi:mRNA-degrading endonuclease RelE of RelBE toxin-antitoxin system